MKDIENFRELEHKYKSTIENIVRKEWKNIPMERTIEMSSDHEDMKLSFDMKFENKLELSIRVRNYNALQYMDMTLRTKSRGGGLTEIDKLIDGKGQYYLYMWENKESTEIEEFILVDIEKLRPYLKVEHCKIAFKSNGDGTSFGSWDIGKMYEWGCIIASSSHIEILEAA